MQLMNQEENISNHTDTGQELVLFQTSEWEKYMILATLTQYFRNFEYF